ncbi:MAG: UDP-glucose--dolichyl-phosphate glucosyltransferase [Flavobacteriaceae bacterium]|nr:UDP-glucose--dolichyl-phosphate glucosyltransferase [Flavobacteriaceae bacterium]
MKSAVKVIIPAYNEAAAISKVIGDIPNFVQEIIVVDNGSTDPTSEVAKRAGATVLIEPNKGYGFACLKGIEYIQNSNQKTDIIVFIDGDYSDYPQQMSEIIAPILNQNIDFVLGSRKKNLSGKGAMLPQQRFGNWLATNLMRLFFDSKFTDLGPFRAIKYQVLKQLSMKDKTYGWTVEMQLKILKQNFTYMEVPVKYRNRIGVSKVSGTLKGTIFAGVKILTWIFKYSFK